MDRAKRLSFEDLPQSIQDSINSYNVPIYTMQVADPAQIRDYFKVLQNQEKLRAGEIINALPDSVFSPYYRRLDTVSFLNKIHYKDSNRNNLEKLYCTLLGMWFGKVQINSENKKTIEFVENLKNLTGSKFNVLKLSIRLSSQLELCLHSSHVCVLPCARWGYCLVLHFIILVITIRIFSRKLNTSVPYRQNLLRFDQVSLRKLRLQNILVMNIPAIRRISSRALLPSIANFLMPQA